MVLEQKVEEEVLAFSSGRSVYVFDDGKPFCIAHRPRIVRALINYNGRLIDSGNYEGVRDTLTGQVIAGETKAWNGLGIFSELLCGSVANAEEDDYGIWDLNRDEVISSRNGQTTLLFGKLGEVLFDSGEYINYTDGPKLDYELMVYNDRTGLILDYPFTAGTWRSNRHYIVASNDRAIEYEFFDPPKFVKKILDLNRVREGDMIISLAEVDKKIYFGTKIGFVGRLIETRRFSKAFDPRFNFENVLSCLPHSISAMTAVPKEVYDDGIKQEIARRKFIRMKHALNAKSPISRAA